MRVILFSQDRVTVETTEVYAYLLILLVFALIASHYVLTECLKDPDRSRYKIMSQIGKGAFGTVSTCKEKSTGLIYAVKIIDKAKVAK